MSGFLERLLNIKGENLSALEKLAQKVGNELHEHGLKQGKEFPNLVKKAVNSVSLPRGAEGYVFWILVDQPRFWPPMSSNLREGLGRAVSLMEKANATPPLDGDFTLPAEDAERDVEEVIMASARWAQNSLRASMFRQYLKVLDKHKGEAAKLLNTDPETARAKLSAVLLVSVKRRPRWFKDGDFLYWALESHLP